MDKDKIKLLEEENFCLKRIIDKVSEGVILTDRNGVITVYNPAKVKMEKIPSEDMLGREVWQAYMYKDKEISEHQKVLETGEPILDVYRPHAFHNGIPVYIYYSTFPVKYKGETIGVFTVSRNESSMRELLFSTIEHKRLSKDKSAIDSEFIAKAKGTQFTFSDIVGSSDKMKAIIKEAQTVAPLSSPILISGETGTGKEVLAQSIHNYRSGHENFVAINCAAIPESLVESVLFGTVKGAYTGAMDSVGLFRLAGSGTLFLDEINSMSVDMQAKLLRALQENSVRPVGSKEEYPIKCRLICASNEEPEKLILEKRLRNDLFYRISGFCISIPPLRERREDIIEMARLYIKKYDHDFHKNIKDMSPKLKDWLYNGTWKGNCRELQNVIQNMMVIAEDTDSILDMCHVPAYALNTTREEEAFKEEETLSQNGEGINEILDNVQRELIEKALRENGFNLTRTAMSLKIGRQNLTSRMKRLNISIKNMQ